MCNMCVKFNKKLNTCGFTNSLRDVFPIPSKPIEFPSLNATLLCLLRVNYYPESYYHTLLFFKALLYL